MPKIKKIYMRRPALPSEYQRVEYIESSGGEYINTGWQPTSSPKIDIDFMFLGGNSDTWCPIYGRRGVNTDNIGLYIQSSSLYVSPNYAGFDPGTSSGLTISKNVKYNIVNDKGQFYIDGVYKSACSTTNTLTQVNYSVYLFENNIQGTPQGRNTQMRLYSCKLYDSNTLVRNLIPCYRISDGVIGLYDLIWGTFYTNAGSGTFTKGADVSTPSLKEYQVYPAPSYEYSYTFKGKTTSQIQSDGWTLLTGSLNVNSNGITGSSSQDCRLAKTIPSLSSAKEIIIQYTVVSSGNTNSATSGFIGYGSGWGTSATGYNMQGSTYTGLCVSCKTTGTTVVGNATGYITAGTHTSTTILNLESKTLVGGTPGYSNSTLTLTDTQINDIKNNYNQLIAYISVNHDSISDISIKVY